MGRLRDLLFLPLLLFLIQCAAGPGTGSVSAASNPEPVPVDETQNASDESPEGSGKSEDSAPSTVEVDNPLVIMDALVQAYPGRINSLEIRDGDWSVLVNGRTFYWAEGRMLPEELRDRAEEFRRYSFRPYPKEIPPVRELSAEEKEFLQSRINRRESGQDARSSEFLIALWGMDGYWDAETTVLIREFLGNRMRIHPDLEESLAEVEDEILQSAKIDAEVADWLESLGPVGAYVWRDIAGSANRSLHSFGIAVDLQPKSYKGTQAYWRWAADLYQEWWAIPREDRYPMPDAVVTAFEAQGFIWGGKWFLFDQIHFEYRPELIILGEWVDTVGN